MPLDPTTLAMIPPDWAKNNRPAVDTSYNGVCTIVTDTSSGGVWDEASGTWSEGDNPLVAGSVPCRVQALAVGRGAAPVPLGGVTNQTAMYLVSVHVDVPAKKDHLVMAITTPADPANNPSWDGVVLRVLEVGKGTEVFDRYLYCTEDQA